MVEFWVLLKVDFTGFSEFQYVTKDKMKVQKIMKSLQKDQSVRKENKVRMMTQSKGGILV